GRFLRLHGEYAAAERPPVTPEVAGSSPVAPVSTVPSQVATACSKLSRHRPTQDSVAPRRRGTTSSGIPRSLPTKSSTRSAEAAQRAERCEVSALGVEHAAHGRSGLYALTVRRAGADIFGLSTR